METHFDKEEVVIWMMERLFVLSKEENNLLLMEGSVCVDQLVNPSVDGMKPSDSFEARRWEADLCQCYRRG